MRMGEEIGRGRKSDAGRNRTREEIGCGKKSDAGGNRRREEIGDGCLAGAGRFISGVRLGKKANNTWRAEKLCYIRLL